MDEKRDDCEKTADGISAENKPSSGNDRKGRCARPFRRVAIGYIDGYEGVGSPSCPDYVPTRHEVLELCGTGSPNGCG